MAKGGTDRNAKRSRLGGRQQRAVWRSAHAWKHRWYATLSRKAHALNDKSTSYREEAKLNKTEQARITAEATLLQKQTLRMWGVA